MKPVGAKTKAAGYTSQNADDEGQMGRGLRESPEGEAQISGDSKATLWGHQSNFRVLAPEVEGHK